MSNLQIVYSSNFVRQFKKLTPRAQKQAIKAEKLFRQDLFSQELKTHKLTGRLDGLWSFSINHLDRIIFEFLGGERILFYKIGNHDIYR